MWARVRFTPFLASLKGPFSELVVKHTAARQCRDGTQTALGDCAGVHWTSGREDHDQRLRFSCVFSQPEHYFLQNRNTLDSKLWDTELYVQWDLGRLVRQGCPQYTVWTDPEVGTSV